MKKNILIINGPNLNLLGKREPEIYGSKTLEEICLETEKLVFLLDKDVSCEWFQSNQEGEIIDRLHRSLEDKILGIIINPGAYTHTSVAIYDALKMIKVPIIEVHLTNTNNRESFRRRKITTMACKGVLEGFKELSYYLAVHSLLLSITSDKEGKK